VLGIHHGDLKKFTSCFSSIDSEPDFRLSGIGCVYNEFDLDPIGILKSTELIFNSKT
jgi:hypothetical protein